MVYKGSVTYKQKGVGIVPVNPNNVLLSDIHKSLLNQIEDNTINEDKTNKDKTSNNIVPIKTNNILPVDNSVHESPGLQAKKHAYSKNHNVYFDCIFGRRYEGPGVPWGPIGP